MKRHLLLFVMLLAGISQAFADGDGTLSIGNVRNAVAGYTGSFDIILSGSSTTYRDFQLDITLPTKLTYKDYTAGSLLDGHSLMKSDQGGNKVRITGYTSAEKKMTAENGVLLTITFSVASDATGTLDDGILDAITFSDVSAKAYHPADATFSVPLSSGITLNESEDYIPETVTGVSVTINRTISKDKWNTIVLPFSMDDSQLKAAFGEDVQLAGFAGYSVNDGNISVEFTTVTTLSAHTPYIIKATSDYSDFTVNNVSITAPDNDLITDKSDGGKTRKMIGTYEDMTIPNNGIYVKDNKFRYSTGLSKLKPFRAYFVFDAADFNPATSGDARSIDFDIFDTTTGIHAVANGQQVSDMDFDLSGRRVSKQQKGVHIKNGHKVIVK